MLQYVEIRGEMARALNVFKMRGSWHDKSVSTLLVRRPQNYRFFPQLRTDYQWWFSHRVTCEWEGGTLPVLLRAFRIMGSDSNQSLYEISVEQINQLITTTLEMRMSSYT